MTADTVTCSGPDADGFAAGAGVDDLSVDVLREAEVMDAAPGGAALLLNDGNTVDIAASQDDPMEAEGRITVSGDGSQGIALGDGNMVTNGGRIDVVGQAAVGVDVTGSMNVVTNSAGATIDVSGDDAIGVRLPDDARDLANLGEILVRGSGATGMQGGDRITGGNTSGVRNGIGGLMEVTGANATGIAVNDDGRVSNLGGMVVEGTGATGIRVNAGNVVLLTAGGSTAVTGTDAVGVQLTGDGNDVSFFQGHQLVVSGDNAIGIRGSGGNNVRIATGSITATGVNSVGVELSSAGAGLASTVTNDDTISASADAAAALRFTGGGSSETSLLNRALIDAPDTVAVDGGDAVEIVTNLGTIRGTVMLGGGDDIFVQAGTLEGSLDGGAGSDALELFDVRLDLGTVSAFETLTLLGGANAPVLSTLAGSGSFADGTEVTSNAGLVLEGPVELTGSYTQRMDGALHLQMFRSDDPVPVPTADRLSVLGAATLEDGSILDVELLDTGPLPAGVVTVLEASGGITAGNLVLQGLPMDSAVLSFSQPEVNGQELQITVAREAYASFGSGNGQRMGAYLDGLLPSASGSTASLLGSLDGLAAGPLSAGLATLQPEAYDAFTSTALTAGLEFTRRLHARPLECGTLEVPERPKLTTLSTCGELGYTPWLDLSGLATTDGGSAFLDYDHVGALTAFGIDARPAEGLLVSGSFGGGYNWIRSDDARGELATIDVGAALAAALGPLVLRGAASYGRGFHDQERMVRLGPSWTNVDGDWESDRVTLLGSVAWPFDAWGWTLAPELQVDYAYLSEQAVQESGGDPSLTVEDRSNDLLGVGGLLRVSSTRLWLGNLNRVPEWYRGTFTRSFFVGMRGVPLGADRDVEARLTSAAPGSGLRAEAEDAAWLARAGVGLRFQPWAYPGSLSVNYAVDVGDGTLLQRAELRLHLPF